MTVDGPGVGPQPRLRTRRHTWRATQSWDDERDSCGDLHTTGGERWYLTAADDGYGGRVTFTYADWTSPLAFAEWGLPDRLAVDHDSVFYDDSSKSPFPTRMHLWLLALGVSLVFGRVGCATDQGMTERSHQLWARQVLVGQRFADWETSYQDLCRRRDFSNTHLPRATLGEVPHPRPIPGPDRTRQRRAGLWTGHTHG